MSNRRATSEDVTVRPFAREDIVPLVDYWTGSSPEFWRARGVDLSKILPRTEFIASYEKAFAERGGVGTVVTILYKGRPVGVHTLTHLVAGDHAVFHAHIFKEEDRHLGIGVFSYLMGAEFFMNKLGLKKIVFKTPKIAKGPNRIKEKIGIPPLGDTVFEAPILVAPLAATLYELDRTLLAQLKIKHGIS